MRDPALTQNVCSVGACPETIGGQRIMVLWYSKICLLRSAHRNGLGIGCDN